MTLLGELHSHDLQRGLSISRVSRAIRIENVCEHPLSTLPVFWFLRYRDMGAVRRPHFSLLQ